MVSFCAKLFKTNHAYDSTPKWILAQLIRDLAIQCQVTQNWQVKLHFNCPKGRRKVIARRVILMVKHFFFKKHLLSHVKRYIKSTQIFTSYRWTNGVENENSQEYFCFEQKQDKIIIIEWQTFIFEAPVAQWTSVLDF